MFDLSDLKKGAMRITFRKKDGSLRIMQCTQCIRMMPKAELAESEVSYNEDQIRVWDLEKTAWRSFRLSSVVSVETLKLYSTMPPEKQDAVLAFVAGESGSDGSVFYL